ncbi:unnamed protein product [Mytilus coruscus]|uniref:DUF3504 domain-containing protein n=1 Tax=Mytilus coruscus TaxID=42192 RepID=A0A6J8BPL4_MYTCO|nr:unnamed protein product [Mytilus coruscus]
MSIKESKNKKKNQYCIWSNEGGEGHRLNQRHLRQTGVCRQGYSRDVKEITTETEGGNLCKETFADGGASIPSDPNCLSNELLNFWMAHFIQECRRMDNSPNPPNSLVHIASGIQRKCLESRMKELTNNGIGSNVKRADSILTSDEETICVQPIGINILSSKMKELFKAASISMTDRNISNQSGKVTCCTTLFNAGFTDSTVKSWSGHRSSTLDMYKRPLEALQENVSKA